MAAITHSFQHQQQFQEVTQVQDSDFQQLFEIPDANSDCFIERESYGSRNIIGIDHSLGKDEPKVEENAESTDWMTIYAFNGISKCLRLTIGSGSDKENRKPAQLSNLDVKNDKVWEDNNGENGDETIPAEKKGRLREISISWFSGLFHK